ncbi:MAG: SpoIID/LytB domain-containing protein [Acidimicrobiales bacterium]
MRSQTLRLLVVTALSVSVLATAQPAGAHDDDPVFTFTGGGWGHGVGMSQYGALGRAEAGQSYAEILSFYYDGTELVTDPGDGTLVPDDVDVLVGVAAAATVSPAGPAGSVLTVAVDGTDVGTTTVALSISRVGGGWVLTDGGPSWCDGVCAGTVLTVSFPDGEGVTIDGIGSYVHGRVELTPAGSDVAKPGDPAETCGSGASFCVVIGSMSMQHYLYGLAEVPSSWPDEALRAQTVAGRSYAVAKMTERADWDEPFDLHASVTDQHWTGWAKESECASFAWCDAVDHTDDQVLTHEGSVITAFYSSSNGGHTASSDEPWSTPLPYLVARPDPLDAAPDGDGVPQNPNFAWEHDYTAADISRWLAEYPFADLDVGEIDHIIIEDVGPSGRIDDALVTLVGSDRTLEVRDSQGEPFGFRFYWALVTGCEATEGCQRLLTTKFAISSFFDVPATAYFASPVRWMVDNGITNGVGPNLFGPDDPNTRGQMAAFLWRFADQPPAILPGPFADVVVGSYNETAIAWMRQSGITNGVEPTLFAPERTITRAEAATMLWRFAGRPTATGANPFDDVPDWAFFAPAVIWMSQWGITTGTSATEFSPADTLTRSQIAAFLWRLAGQPDAFAEGVTLPSAMRAP